MSDWPIIQIAQADSRYPKTLQQIADPPKILYCRGNIELLDSFCIGIVGTRKATPYGKDVAHLMASGIAPYGVTVVSGLALGIDSAAHQGALASHGKTIAVLGTGIDDASIYPRSNLRLAKEILNQNGLLVSEYPEGTPGQQWTFPARNRIISGLSRGVVIVEADIKSGAMITARCALDQNRDVFAVPGSIRAPRSEGPHWLIRQGAILVSSVQDILDTYGISVEKISDAAQHLSTQNPVQKKILAILSTDGPLPLDAIVQKMDMDASSVMAAVTLLELNGMITITGEGIYAPSK